jgi:hypothetical protein
MAAKSPSEEGNLTTDARPRHDEQSPHDPLPGPGRDDLLELPDDAPGTVYSVCGGDPPPGWDEYDDDPDAEDCDIEGLGPPPSRCLSRHAWDPERECPYLIESDEDDGYRD